jgi:ferric-dicitrate binding protein FerR (iron transport regulator)
MKRPSSIDSLEQTMENPDLPPLTAAPAAAVAAPSRSTRRSLRRTLVLGALLLAGVFVALRLIVA